MRKSSGNLKRTSLFQSGLATDGPAFTLTELMVVIGVVALLAATLLPALAQSQMKTQAVVCLSHMRQLQRAALLYASDNNNSVPRNFPLSPQGNEGAVGGPPDWVYGTMGWRGNPGNPAGCSTNPFYLGVNGITGPADRYLDPTYHVLRVRSYSANMYIGSGTGWTGIINT